MDLYSIGTGIMFMGSFLLVYAWLDERKKRKRIERDNQEMYEVAQEWWQHTETQREAIAQATNDLPCLYDDYDKDNEPTVSRRLIKVNEHDT